MTNGSFPSFFHSAACKFFFLKNLEILKKRMRLASVAPQEIACRKIRERKIHRYICLDSIV